MQKEIEVKAKVKDVLVLKSKIEKLGSVLSDPIIQDDTVFINFTGDFTKSAPGTNFLRIRKAKGKILFTLKQSQKNDLDCIEKEVEISDAVQFKEALELMGYHEAVQVHKTRMKTKYNGMEICLDEVQGLGSFIEVEKITEGDGEVIQDELFQFLQTLGVQKEDRVMIGYDTLIYLKNNSQNN